MLFRFTLSNSIEGSQVISDPDGWKEIKIKLERDKDFHSLVEMIEVPLIFYGSNGDVDGGYDYIRNVEDTQGVDAIIEILIEVSDGGDYETFFEGVLALDTIKDIGDAEFYKLECNIVRNDFWSKFVNRRSQKVNLNATTSLDGDSLTPVYDINLYLLNQKLRLLYRGAAITSTIDSGNIGSTNDYLQVSLPITLDEINERYTLPSAINTSLPSWTFAMKYDGDYAFDYRYEISAITSAVSVVPIGPNLEYYIQKNNDAAILFTKTDVANGASDVDPGFTSYEYNSTLSLLKGDIIRIYGQFTGNQAIGTINLLWGTSPYFAIPVPTGSTGSYDSIIGDTRFNATETDAFLLRDAAESVLSKIISRDNVLYSNYLGDETPTACAANFAIMKGLHVRGYTMADKPMTMSFDEWWQGANPIFNLGLGYETINGTEYIRIEHKGYFYDDDPILTFSNVDKITRVYDKDSIIKNIEIGYERWSAESASGVDDPQTKHTYNTRFKIIGKDEKILSKFFAASLGIEQTRRNRVEFGKDWRLDEETIIIALSNDATPYQPELDENFSSITNLLNSETRYNIRLTPARNFIRWRPYFNGCLQGYADTYKFASGEGNYDMQATWDDSCDSGTLAENQNIALTSDHYHLAEAYEFEYYLSWEDYKTLRNNRHRAIEVSQTTSNYKTCHIQEMEFDHYNSMAKFTVWIKD